MTDSISDVKYTHITYFNEKYYSILAELKNLYSIINYYNNKQLQRDENSVVDTFNILEDDIRELILYIKDVREDNKYGLIRLNEVKNSLNFLVLLDVHKTKMENILEHFSALHQKCIQIIYETSPQVLPHPLLQKRYSSKVLSEFLEEHTQTLYSMLTDKKDKKILSYWTHKEDYKVTKGSVDTLVDFNGQSFYYHDLIYSIPATIDHEIILLAIQGNKKVEKSVKELHEELKKLMNNNLDKIKKEMETELEQFCKNMNSSNKVFESYIAKKDYYRRIDNFINQFDDVLWELVADYIGFLMYGDAYKLAFMHETLSKSLGRDFYDGSMGMLKKSISIGLNKQRDGLLLRQLLVLNFEKVAEGKYPCSKLLLASDEKNYLNVIKEILKSFIDYGQNKKDEECITKTSDQFKNVLEIIKLDDELEKEAKSKLELEIDNHISNFNEYANFMQSFYKILQKFLNKKSNLWGEFKFIADKFNQNDFFKNDTFAHLFNGHPDEYLFALEIWKERFEALKEEKVPHRSLLRNHILNPSKKHKAYIMEFERSLLGDMQHEKISLGLFDNIRIRPAIKEEEDIGNNWIDINMRIEDLLDVTKLDKLDTSFIKKHSLLKVFEEGEDKSGNCTLYLQLFLKKSRDITGINEIIKKLKEDKRIKSTTSQRTLYKSLGPEDLVYELKDVEQNKIWTTIEHILTAYKDYFLDSYTIIQLNRMTLDENIWIKSKCKLKTVLTYDAFVSEIRNASPLNNDKINDEKLQIFDMAGNHDFEIWWNVDNFGEILETYNYLKKEVISEMQFYLMNDVSNRNST